LFAPGLLSRAVCSTYQLAVRPADSATTILLLTHDT
jgi:hypothetical protein